MRDNRVLFIDFAKGIAKSREKCPVVEVHI